MNSVASIQEKPKHVLVAVLLLGFIAGIQTTDPIISSIALVDASKTLQFTSQTTALASGISTLALAATVITTGLLADRIGRRFLLMIALIVTIIGDVLVASSVNSPMYLAGRVIAGVGLGAVFGSSFAYIRAVAPDHIGSALGQFGAMNGIITMLAGLLGGTLVTTSWRLAYLVVPVLCVIGLLLVPFLLPRVPKIKSGAIDYLGMASIAVGVIGILYGVSQMSSSLTALSTWIPIGIGIVSLGVFVVVERKSSSPVFPLQLLKNPFFIAAAITVLVWNFSQSVTILQLSNLWQYIERYTPTMVTFGQLPMSIIGIVSSIVVGRSLSKGKSLESRILLGLLIMALGFICFALIPAHSEYWMYLPALLLIGFGMPYAVVPSGQMFMSKAPEKFFGAVTSSKTTIGQFGYSFGLAGSMVLVSSLTNGGITQKLIQSGVPPSQTGQGLDAVTVFADTGVHASTKIGQEALQSAAGSYSGAFSVAMFVAAAICIITAILVFVLLKREARNSTKQPQNVSSQ